MMKQHKSLACSVIGYRKKSEGLLLEDASMSLRLGKHTVLAVADGHGDRRCIFAHAGSAIAVKVACAVCKRYIKARGRRAPSLYWNESREEIGRAVVTAFAHAVLDDYRKRCPEKLETTGYDALEAYIDEAFAPRNGSFTPAELRRIYTKRKQMRDTLEGILYLYGTTLRATVVADSYVFNLALGDGDTVAITERGVEWLLPKAEAYECRTASLCEPFDTVMEDMVFSYMPIGLRCRDKELADTASEVRAVLLSTDGLRNSFFSSEGYEEKVLAIARAVKEKRAENARKSLRRLFAKLSRESVFQDDISAAVTILCDE